MKIKLTLDEKYKELVDDIVGVENPNCSYFFDNYSKSICELTKKWFCDEAYCSQVKVIERIHSTDDIEWIEHKYYWRLKTNKVHNNYMCPDAEGVFFTDEEGYRFTSPMTESELKKLLEGTGLPFEAFEKVEADEED